MAAEMRGPTPSSASRGPGLNRRVSSVFDMGGGARKDSPAISSPPKRGSSRPSLGQAQSFSVGAGGGAGGSEEYDEG